jgi:hypothetical protein
MTDATTSSMAIMLGVGVFLIIVAVGWRSVQKRRILRLQGSKGSETIVIACEDDDVTSVVTTAEPQKSA